MNNNNISVAILVGIVSQFSLERDFGIVLVEGHSCSYSLSGKTSRKVMSGLNLPYFSGANAPNNAKPGDLIVLTLDSNKKVTSWALKDHWDAAISLIKGRKQTHSARSAQFMARFTKQIQAARVQPTVEAKKPKQFGITLRPSLCIA